MAADKPLWREVSLENVVEDTRLGIEEVIEEAVRVLVLGKVVAMGV